MFLTPIDVPFMFAMTWSPSPIMLMAVPIVPFVAATMCHRIVHGPRHGDPLVRAITPSTSSVQ